MKNREGYQGRGTEGNLNSHREGGFDSAFEFEARLRQDMR